jgi:hypothetical protein
MIYWNPDRPIRGQRTLDRRINSCLNELGNPKQAFPNHQTALWFTLNIPRSTVRECKPYQCPECKLWHYGRPKQPKTIRLSRKRMKSRAFLMLWRQHQSWIDYPVEDG